VKVKSKLFGYESNKHGLFFHGDLTALKNFYQNRFQQACIVWAFKLDLPLFCKTVVLNLRFANHRDLREDFKGYLDGSWVFMYCYFV